MGKSLSDRLVQLFFNRVTEAVLDYAEVRRAKFVRMDREPLQRIPWVSCSADTGHATAFHLKVVLCGSPSSKDPEFHIVTPEYSFGLEDMDGLDDISDCLSEEGDFDGEYFLNWDTSGLTNPLGYVDRIETINEVSLALEKILSLGGLVVQKRTTNGESVASFICKRELTPRVIALITLSARHGGEFGDSGKPVIRFEPQVRRRRQKVETLVEKVAETKP